MTTETNITGIRETWRAIAAGDYPKRPRDAAMELGISEAELVASGCGETVTRLDADWGQFIARLPEIGRVMALTRNEHVVHEKTGAFGNVSVAGAMGIVLNHDIDLRLFLNHWHHGFAVTTQTKDGPRRSIQFFDLDGMAVHKVYPQVDAEMAAFDALIAAHAAADQSPLLSVVAAPEPRADRPDHDIDVQALRDHWAALKDVHHFHGMLKELDVGRAQAMRLVGAEFAEPLTLDATRQVLEQAASRAVPIMVFTGNAGCIQIHSGPVHTIKPMGPWLNVLDPGFKLHLREDRIAEAWRVRKPQRDSRVTSLELYDHAGQNFTSIFGLRKGGEPEREDWRDLIEALPRGRAVELAAQ